MEHIGYRIFLTIFCALNLMSCGIAIIYKKIIIGLISTIITIISLVFVWLI